MKYDIYIKYWSIPDVTIHIETDYYEVGVFLYYTSYIKTKKVHNYLPISTMKEFNIKESV